MSLDVAENRKLVRFLGTFAMIALISFSNSRVSIRSASSSTWARCVQSIWKVFARVWLHNSACARVSHGDRGSGKDIGSDVDRRTDRQTDRHTHTYTDTHTHTDTDRQTDTHTDTRNLP